MPLAGFSRGGVGKKSHQCDLGAGPPGDRAVFCDRTLGSLLARVCTSIERLLQLRLLLAAFFPLLSQYEMISFHLLQSFPLGFF